MLVYIHFGRVFIKYQREIDYNNFLLETDFVEIRDEELVMVETLEQ